MYNLARLNYRDMMRCRADLRELFQEQPPTLGEAAQRIVHFFYTNFLTDDGQPACALVRLFKTHPYASLDRESKEFADAILAGRPAPNDLRCLVLLATAGAEPQWNSRQESKGHKAIPLASEKVVRDAPMISQLIQQFGVKISTVLRPDPALLLDEGEKAYNVFHVPEALGSPYIVAQQEFVQPYGIRSVVGFGGMMPPGDLFAVILFTMVPISHEVADLFKVIGLNLRVIMLPLSRKPLF